MTGDVLAVATDGTGSSNAAVDWAAHEAWRRGLPLLIVHAFDWAGHDTGGEYVAVARHMADGIVAAAAVRAQEAEPGLTVRTDTLIGPAVPRLLEVAGRVRLLVLGSRGRGGFAGLLLGSVSRRVATHSRGPVVVVRGPGTADGPIAAGVDDSPAAGAVLETALTAAAEQDCPLLVVRAYLPAVPLWLSDVAPPTVETAEQDAAERERLEETLAPWRAKYPDVPLTVEVTHLSPAYALVRASRRARTVIVGSRGHGVLAGTLLGSVGVQLLHHAECPVHIVRAIR